jgi:hypothetical protein
MDEYIVVTIVETTEIYIPVELLEEEYERRMTALLSFCRTGVWPDE